MGTRAVPRKSGSRSRVRGTRTGACVGRRWASRSAAGPRSRSRAGSPRRASASAASGRSQQHQHRHPRFGRTAVRVRGREGADRGGSRDHGTGQHAAEQRTEAEPWANARGQQHERQGDDQRFSSPPADSSEAGCGRRGRGQRGSDRENHVPAADREAPCQFGSPVAWNTGSRGWRRRRRGSRRARRRPGPVGRVRRSGGSVPRPEGPGLRRSAEEREDDHQHRGTDDGIGFGTGPAPPRGGRPRRRASPRPGCRSHEPPSEDVGGIACTRVRRSWSPTMSPIQARARPRIGRRASNASPSTAEARGVR